MFDNRNGRYGLAIMIFMIIAGLFYLNISDMLRKENTDEEMGENFYEN